MTRLDTIDTTPEIGVELVIADGLFRGVHGRVTRYWLFTDRHYLVDLAFQRPVLCGQQWVDSMVLAVSQTRSPR
jgi:hypothetical protein